MRKGTDIPLYAMLDVWMALGLPPDEFEPWLVADLGAIRAEAWSFLLAAVRGDDLTENHNPPPGRLVRLLKELLP